MKIFLIGSCLALLFVFGSQDLAFSSMKYDYESPPELQEPVKQSTKQSTQMHVPVDQHSIVRLKDHIEVPSTVPISVDYGERAETSGGQLGYADLFMLHRSGESRICAVVALLYDGRTILNPRYLEFEYGPIPDLNELDIHTADTLWRDDLQKSKKKSSRLFELVSENTSGMKVPPQKFRLEIVFENQLLKKYRIHGNKIFSKWIDAANCRIYSK